MNGDEAEVVHADEQTQNHQPKSHGDGHGHGDGPVGLFLKKNSNFYQAHFLIIEKWSRKYLK